MQHARDTAAGEALAPGPVDRSKPGWAVGSLLLANLLWACTYTMVKAVSDDISPLAISFWRLFLPTLVMLPLVLGEWRRARPTLADRRRLVYMGLVGCTLANTFQFLGLHHSLASNIALLISTETVITIALSVAFLGEVIDARKALGFLLALAGFLMVSDVDWGHLALFDGKYLLGNTLMIVSCLCYSIYTIISKDIIRRYSATLVTTLPLLWGTVAMVPLMAAFEPHSLTAWLNYQPRTWATVLVIAVFCTVLGYWLWNWALGILDASTVALTLYVQPVAGVLVAHFWLGEPLSSAMVLGGLLILASVVLCSGLGARPSAAQP